MSIPLPQWRRSLACGLAWLSSISLCVAQVPSGRLKVQPPEPAAPAVEVSGDYRLSANDVIHVIVFQEEELETTARIGRNGTITFPLIKTANVAGLTRQEAEQRLETLLLEYLKRPQVAVRIVEYTKRRYTVLGQVSNPGAFELPDHGNLDLLEAIGIAGGYTRIANPSKITVKRTVGGREVMHRLDAKKMANQETSTRFQILAGDLIVVGESIF